MALRLSHWPLPLRFAAGVAVIAAIVAVHRSLAVNPTTVGLTLLLAVLIFAATSGLWVALFVALLATLCFNYFFLPPVHTFTISNPQDWVALLTFLITAVVGSQLAERARRQAQAADRRRTEAEHLYGQLVKARTEAEAEQLKSALLDSIAHEVRTPLTAIKASVTSLLTGPAMSDGDRRELLHVVDEESDRLNRLLGEALEMARLDAGDLQLEFAPHHLDEAVQAALERIRRLLAGREVQVAVARDLPPARMDLERVVQVLVHLLDNAARYSQGAIRVGAECENGWIEVSVADSGPGIAADEQAQIFDKFYRGKEQRLKVQGTGLGLAIARAIVAAHGGSLGVRSRPGEGAVFRFTVPQAKSAR